MHLFALYPVLVTNPFRQRTQERAKEARSFKGVEAAASRTRFEGVSEATAGLGAAENLLSPGGLRSCKNRRINW